MAVYAPPMPTTLRNRYRFVTLATLAIAACGGGGGQYQGMEPEVLFELAKTEFAEGDHGNAIEVLDRLLIAHGDWDRIPEARLMLGDVYMDRGDYLTARSEYDRFIDRYAGHPGSPHASLGVCKALSALAPTPQRDQTYTEDAITSCRNVVLDYGGLPQSSEAAVISNELRLTLAEKEYMNADFYFRRGLNDSAIKYYEFVARLYPESKFAPLALLGIYRANQEIGYDDLAEEARQRLLTQYPDSESAAEIRIDGSGA